MNRIILVAFFGILIGLGSCAEEETAAAIVGVDTTKISRGGSLVFDASQSIFSTIKWYLSGDPISSCTDEVICSISFRSSGTQIVRIQVELKDEGGGLFGGLGGSTSSKDQKTIQITVSASSNVGGFSISTFELGGDDSSEVGSENGDDSDSAFDRKAPTVSFVSPNNGATGIALNSSVSASFSESIDPSTLNTASFKLESGGNFVTGVVNVSETSATFVPSGFMSASNTYVATLNTSIEDSAGNALADTHGWSFTTGTTIDTRAPTVSSTSPVSGASSVAISSSLTITFSEAMDASSLNSNTFILSSGGSSLSGDVTISGLTATFNPNSDLSNSTTYTATISTEVQDSAGNSLASSYSWSFTAAGKNEFSIGGSISGLVGTVILQNNSADDLTLTNNGSFTFPTSVVSGSSYAVTIATQPGGVTCTLKNSSGTISANITNISVSCVDDQAPSTGNSGVITTANISGTILTLNWSVSSDVISIPSALSYKVVRASNSTDIDTVAEANAISGTDLLQIWSTNINTFDVTSLSFGTTYFFNVLVKDEIGNKAIYSAVQGITLSPNWKFVDGNGADGMNKDTGKAAIDSKGILFNSKFYAGWTERNASSVNQVRVAVYNENDSSPVWNFVGGNGADGINYNATKHAGIAAFSVHNSKLYMTWAENSPTTSQIRVAVYNGNDGSPSWAFVDGNGTSGLNKNTTTNSSYFSEMYSFNSKLYIAWYEWDLVKDQIRVAVYNGNDSSPSWNFIDGDGAKGLNKDTNQGAIQPQFAEFNSKLYIIWYENNGSSNQVRFLVYNGNDGSPSWTFLDGNGTTGLNKDTSQWAQNPSLFPFNSKLYAIWSENTAVAAQIRVAVYNANDSSPSWSFVDGNGTNGINKNTTKNAFIPRMISLNSSLYAVWYESDGSKDQIRVSVYNGNDASPSWTIIDGNATTGLNKNTAQIAIRPSPIVLNSKLYLIWNESNGTKDQIRVKWLDYQ